MFSRIFLKQFFRIWSMLTTKDTEKSFIAITLILLCEQFREETGNETKKKKFLDPVWVQCLWCKGEDVNQNHLLSRQRWILSPITGVVLEPSFTRPHLFKICNIRNMCIVCCSTLMHTAKHAFEHNTIAPSTWDTLRVAHITPPFS